MAGSRAAVAPLSLADDEIIVARIAARRHGDDLAEPIDIDTALALVSTNLRVDTMIDWPFVLARTSRADVGTRGDAPPIGTLPSRLRSS